MASSISPALKSTARSAYRSLFRASGATFAGDDRVLYAFRDKVRKETVAGRQVFDPLEYEARVKHAFEVAEVLRKNVVQAVKQGQGEDAAWKIRMTSDTELGSNEGVKAPYSRPARGTPRPKCGEDPNAVAPLPPRSLRKDNDTGFPSTRSYSTSASTTTEQEKPEQQESKELYDRIRVEHLRNRLKEVNRRVAASPIGQGREPLVDRVLVEDKLGALSARMDFLASEMHDRIYHTPATPDVAAIPAPPTAETPTRVTTQTLIDVLLDLLPIDPECVPQSNSPPVQLRQYVRYVQAAGKYAAVARAESLLLSNSTRSAIGEETETSTSTRGSDSTINEVRALLWRALMIKRGMQRVIQAGIAAPSELSSMAWAVKLVLRYLTYARECIEDLEARGPKSEDARALFEEVEQTTEGLVLLELRKWTEKRIKEGTAWERVDNEIVKLCGDKTNQPEGKKESMWSKLRPIYVRLRKVETLYPPPPRLDVRPDGSTGTTGPHYRWRAKSIGRPLKLLKVMYQYILSFCDTLDRLALLVCEDAEKAAILREAKAAIDLPEEVGQAMSDHLFRKAGPATCHQWAYVLNNQRQTIDKIKFQLRAADAHLRLFRGAMLEDGERQSQEIREAFYDARLELMIAYDVIWRTSNRLAQDAEKMLEMGEELNEGSWKEPQRERISSR